MASPFEDKRKALFDSLISAEVCIVGTSLEQRQTSPPNKERKQEPKDVGRRFQGKESIFKRPAAPISKCLKPRRAPDHQINPHKWKKYSLADADTSDNTNSSAAFAFLSEIAKRKQQSDSSDTDADTVDIEQGTSSKIVFNQRKKVRFNRSVQYHQLRDELEQSKTTDTVEDRAVMKGSKVVLPEYVVGQKNTHKEKRKKPSTVSAVSSSSDKQLKLQHLMDENEDEND